MSGVALGSTAAVAVGSEVGAGPGGTAQEARKKMHNAQFTMLNTVANCEL
jgi:hypothetical protein